MFWKIIWDVGWKMNWKGVIRDIRDYMELGRLFRR